MNRALQNIENKLRQIPKNAIAKKLEYALQAYPFDDISPDLKLKINPRAKRMALRLDARARVVNLVIPKRASIRSAYHFAREHQQWIREQLDTLPDQIHLSHGAEISILGQSFTLDIHYDSALRRTDIAFQDSYLKISTNKQDPTSRLKRFLINHAREEITKLAHAKAATIEKKITKIDLKDTKTRWGSCSHDGVLSYSWRLIFAAPEAFDYVVAHEVAHLKHMDHSPAFWMQCEDLCLDYSKGKSWMRNNSDLLHRYKL
ncbi:MAG: M48 family metallopeptidase [Alphaproteobacteria bacterium]|nr:M48 family metallopeptidase [Alphaproteobacteria bacterium]